MKHIQGRTMTSLFGLLALLLVFFAPGPAAGQNIVKLKQDVAVQAGSQVDSAVAIGGSVSVEGTVRKDAVAFGGSVFLGPKAVVRGNVVSVGGMVVKQEGAQVYGDTTVFDISRAATFLYPLTHDWWYWPSPFPAVPRFIPMLGFLTLTLLTVALAPRMIGFISSTIGQGPIASFFWGLLGSASIFPISFLLLISIIGIILIPFQILAAGVCFFLGYVSVVQLLGRKILAAARVHDKPMILETLLGMVALWLVSQAPLAGWLFVTLAMIVGFGGVLASLFRRMLWGRPPGPLV